MRYRDTCLAEIAPVLSSVLVYNTPATPRSDAKFDRLCIAAGGREKRRRRRATLRQHRQNLACDSWYLYIASLYRSRLFRFIRVVVTLSAAFCALQRSSDAVLLRAAFRINTFATSQFSIASNACPCLTIHYSPSFINGKWLGDLTFGNSFFLLHTEGFSINQREFDNILLFRHKCLKNVLVSQPYICFTFTSLRELGQRHLMG